MRSGAPTAHTVPYARAKHDICIHDRIGGKQVSPQVKREAHKRGWLWRDAPRTTATKTGRGGQAGDYHFDFPPLNEIMGDLYEFPPVTEVHVWYKLFDSGSKARFEALSEVRGRPESTRPPSPAWIEAQWMVQQLGITNPVTCTHAIDHCVVFASILTQENTVVLRNRTEY